MRTDRAAFARFPHNPMISLFTVIVAAGACMITFVVARRVFQDHLRLGPPGLLAAAVAGLAFLGLTSHGSSLLAVLLLPYAALAITLLLVLLLFRLSPWLQRNSKQPPSCTLPPPTAGHRRCRPITGPKPAGISELRRGDRPKLAAESNRLPAAGVAPAERERL
jgi:hypothetical protein